MDKTRNWFDRVLCNTLVSLWYIMDRFLFIWHVMGLALSLSQGHKRRTRYIYIWFTDLHVVRLVQPMYDTKSGHGCR